MNIWNAELSCNGVIEQERTHVQEDRRHYYTVSKSGGFLETASMTHRDLYRLFV